MQGCMRACSALAPPCSVSAPSNRHKKSLHKGGFFALHTISYRNADKYLVPEGGIEPARTLIRQILNLLRLPISPLRQEKKNLSWLLWHKIAHTLSSPRNLKQFFYCCADHPTSGTSQHESASIGTQQQQQQHYPALLQPNRCCGKIRAWNTTSNLTPAHCIAHCLSSKPRKH